MEVTLGLRSFRLFRPLMFFVLWSLATETPFQRSVLCSQPTVLGHCLRGRWLLPGIPVHMLHSRCIRLGESQEWIHLRKSILPDIRQHSPCICNWSMVQQQRESCQNLSQVSNVLDLTWSRTCSFQFKGSIWFRSRWRLRNSPILIALWRFTSVVSSFSTSVFATNCNEGNWDRISVLAPGNLGKLLPCLPIFGNFRRLAR